MNITLDYENFGLLNDGQPIEWRDAYTICKEYERMCTAEYLYENQEWLLKHFPKGTRLTQEGAYEIACIVRDSIDDYNCDDTDFINDVLIDLCPGDIDGLFIPGEDEE